MIGMSMLSVPPTSRWAALLQWAGVLASNTPPPAVFVIIRGRLSRLAAQAGSEELSDSLRTATPAELPGVLAKVGTDVASGMEALISERLVVYLRSQADRLKALQETGSGSGVTHPFFRPPPSPRPIETTDEIDALLIGIEEGLSDILKTLVSLYQNPNGFRRIQSQSVFPVVLREVRGEADVVRSYLGRVSAATLQLIRFRPQLYRAALEKIDQALVCFTEIQEEGLTDPLSARIHTLLTEMAKLLLSFYVPLR